VRTFQVSPTLIAAVCCAVAAWAAASSNGSTEKDNSELNVVHDAFVPTSPRAVSLSGFLGRRCEANINQWLIAKDEDSLLVCYAHRPSSYGWQGEHAGKWIQAATVAWASSGNTQLRAKLDRVVRKLLAAQQDDGYLGTYREGFHWAAGKNEKWDVWVHAHNLMGLLIYAHHANDRVALDASKRIAALLIATFGPRGKLNINSRSPHRGMVSGSVLEPMVLLYALTNDRRYLEFAKYVVKRWAQPEGSELLSSLTAGISVSETANGKAYEMLTCLIGLCELYRATGDRQYFIPVLNAWNDIKNKQLLPTGSGSQREYWAKGEAICSDSCDGLAEVCVTVGWLQLNQQLLRLTGDVRYADEMEKTLYNHLAAAQKPDGSAWSYFTELRGTRSYSNKQTCCSSSGPRGWASVPSYAYMLVSDGIVVNLYTPGTARLSLPSGDSVVIKQTTDYPKSGNVEFSVTVSAPVEFVLHFRVPTWSYLRDNANVSGTYYRIARHWVGSTSLKLTIDIPTRFDFCKFDDERHAVLARGPQVLAFDEKFNPSPILQRGYRIQRIQPFPRVISGFSDDDKHPVYSLSTIRYLENGKNDTVPILLNPFSSSGAHGTSYNVWLPIVKESRPARLQQ
jgi:DUF1680 family protein